MERAKSPLANVGADMAQAGAAANRILSFREQGKSEKNEALQLQDTAGGVKIELEDLWFKYPTRDIPIFSGLNLTVSRPKMNRGVIMTWK